MDISFKANQLLLPELNYELRIRDVVTDKHIDDKRKILGRLLHKERQKCFDISTLKDPNFNFDLEKTEIDSTLTSIENLISDFEGPSSDSCFRRANTRLIHVNQRIQRIQGEDDLILKYKREAFATALKLEADLYDRVRENEPNVSMNVTNSEFNAQNSITQQPLVIPSSSKSFPVYKLGIQFNGDPKTLLSFIEKVEELSFSRNVSKVDLFHSASDLFTDKATFWFRQVKSSVNDWDSLIEKLKKDFLCSDFDDELWGQIKARKQGRYEPVVIYVACMEALFARLSHSPAETTKVKYTKQGLQVEYQKRLALSDIDSLETLSKLCKKLEEADVLSLASSASNSNYSIDPELAYISDNVSLSQIKNNVQKHKHPFNRKFQQKPNTAKKSTLVNSIEINNSNQKNSLVCWSCNLPNHTFRHCLSQSKKKFCYKCGSPNVTVKDCNKCSGNAQ